MTVYLYLSSEDCPNVTTNTNDNFVVNLVDALDLSDSTYYCSLRDIYFHNQHLKQRVYIFCDIIDFSIVKNAYHPILIPLVTAEKVINPTYHKVKQSYIRSIRITLLTYENKQFNRAILDGVTDLVLAFDKV